MRNSLGMQEVNGISREDYVSYTPSESFSGVYLGPVTVIHRDIEIHFPTRCFRLFDAENLMGVLHAEITYSYLILGSLDTTHLDPSMSCGRFS